MPNYNKDTINKLNAISILEVAERFEIEVKSNHAICWLHRDKNPSLSFDVRKNRWKCFGCDASGGVIDLVKTRLNLSFPDACQQICSEFNITSSSYYKKNRTVRATPLPKAPDNYFRPDTEVFQWIIDNTNISEVAKRYIIDQRHFPETVIDKYKIRSTSNNDGLLKKCIDRFGQERLLRSGIAKIRKNKDKPEFTWFGDVLLFPYLNQNDDVVYIQARKIDSISKFKYINPNQIETIPYNLSILKKLNHGESIVICEGVMDCISLELLGKNAIGIIGASGFKSQYVTLFRSFKIIVIPDNDAAGYKFAKKIEEEFLKIGKTIKTLKLHNDFKDITEYYESTIKQKNEPS